jgi:hypothetical protein
LTSQYPWAKFTRPFFIELIRHVDVFFGTQHPRSHFKLSAAFEELGKVTARFEGSIQEINP